MCQFNRSFKWKNKKRNDIDIHDLVSTCTLNISNKQQKKTRI